MKKILSYLIVFVLGISITVGASYLYKASDIEYSNINSEATNVKDAIDELIEFNNNIDKHSLFKVVSNESGYYYVDCGFKPKRIFIHRSNGLLTYYLEEESTTRTTTIVPDGRVEYCDLPNATCSMIYNVTDNGFYLRLAEPSMTYYILADK